MSRLIICLFLFFNLLALISGCLAIGSSLYFHRHGVTDCQYAVQAPLMGIGIILIVISVIGLIGGVCRLTYLLWLYSFLAFMAFFGLTLFTIFAYMANNLSGSSGLGFKKHNIGDYSLWLQNNVENGKNWNRIRACLIDHQICKSLDKKKKKADDFYNKKLSYPVESGCCKPPIQCGYKYKNATFWMVPKSGPAAKDTDCTSWSNNQDKLCYNCNSCKAGVVDMSRMTWRIFTLLDTIDIAITVIIFALSCCIRKKILSDKKYTRVHP